MNRIITISREFGSGGREVGKRLADALHCAYYDSEIEASIAQNMDLDEGFIARSIGNGALTNIPLHFGRTIASSYLYKQQVDILVEKRRVLRQVAAASDCVIVGRAADVILEDLAPFKLFVYASMDHKLARCRRYEETGHLDSRDVFPRQVGRPGQLPPVHQYHRAGDQTADLPPGRICRGLVCHERPINQTGGTGQRACQFRLFVV